MDALSLYHAPPSTELAVHLTIGVVAISILLSFIWHRLNAVRVAEQENPNPTVSRGFYLHSLAINCNHCSFSLSFTPTVLISAQNDLEASDFCSKISQELLTN